MSEFLEGGNQTAETEVTPNQEQQQSSPEGGQQNPNVSEQFDIIKYNKEETQIPIEKRQDYLQMGYHYEQKVKGELESLQSENAYIDKMMKIGGFADRQEFFEALQEQERQAQIEAEAGRIGVTPEAYQQFLAPVNEEISTLKGQLEQYQQQEAIRNVDAEVLGLTSKYSDFKDHEAAVFDLAIQKGYNLEDSYILVTHAAKVEAAKQEAQQAAITSLQAKQMNSVGSLSGGDGGHKTSISSLSKEDFEKLTKGVLSGQIKQF